MLSLIHSGYATDGGNSRSDGTSALHWAAHRGHAACIQALLANGADVNVVDRCVNHMSVLSAASMAPLIFIPEKGIIPCTILLNCVRLPNIPAVNPYLLLILPIFVSIMMKLVTSIYSVHACIDS